MIDINKVILLGRLGADPVRKNVSNGTAVVGFSLATGRRIFSSAPNTEVSDQTTPAQGSSEFKEETQWHRVVCWGRQAEACAQYLKKGSPVYVEGRFQSKKWQGSDGQYKTSTEVVAEKISFLA